MKANKLALRFGRDSARPSNNLFSSYPDSSDASRNRSSSPSKYNKKSSPGYGFAPTASSATASPSHSPAFGTTYSGSGAPAFSAYPGSSANGGYGVGGSGPAPGFRTATPNSRGQYSAAVLDELESQNDEQVGVMMGKVRELKNVCLWLFIFPWVWSLGVAGWDGWDGMEWGLSRGMPLLLLCPLLLFPPTPAFLAHPLRSFFFLIPEHPY